MNPLIASIIGPCGAEQFARTTGRRLGDLDAAKRLLSGRRWSELPREDKLKIRRNTGWQLGPGGDWVYETDTDPILTPAFNERFSPWLAADKGFSATLKTLYDTVKSLKVEESAIANSWNERHPRNLYSSLLPHVYNPSYAPRGFAAESALSDYDSAVKFAAKLREDGLVDTRNREMYQTAKRFLDRPELSKAIVELSNAMKRAKEAKFKPFAGRLSDMVDLSADPEFAIAYPDFKDTDVAVVDEEDPALMGSFSARDNKITITKRNLQKHGLSGALRTALHELAHERQDKEGMAPGGNKMTYIVDGPPGRDLLGAYREKLTRMEDTLANGSWLAKQLLGGPETLRNRIDIYRRTLAFLDQERSRFDQIVSRADQAGDEGSKKYYLYRRLAGEVDARNTVTRQGLDREARSSTLLEDTEDVPRSDQIDARFGVVPGGTISKAATVLDEHPHILQQAAKGGDTRADAKGDDTDKGVPSGHNPALDGHGGPRIVVNPSTFGSEKDALCVAFDEGFRILMEHMDFECVSEPTDEQRRFFADTAYADDEVQLRRTILARICTLDTSVKDPTDEQLQEAVEFLDSVMESGAPQNEWEQRSVQRLRDIVAAIPPAGKAPPASGVDVEPEGDSGAQVQAAIGGGETVDEEEEKAHEKALVEKEAETTKGQDLNGDGSVIDHSKDEKVAGVGQKDTAGGEGSEPGEEPAKPGEEPPQDARNDSNPEIRAVYQNEPKDDTDGLTVHIGATVGISDSGGTGGNRQQTREPLRGTIEAGLHADNPANRLEGGTHTRDGLGGIGDGLRAVNPSNRLEGGTHTRDGMAGAINKPITTAAEMGPKVSEDGRIDKPVRKRENPV